MLKNLLIAIFIFISASLYAQHGDCVNALPLTDTVHTEEKVNGSGKVIEIAGNELGNKYYFTEEHNTMWYKLTAPAGGEFTFELIPLNKNDDWDFLLFKIDGDNNSFCNKIKSKMVKPVRTNISRNNIAIGGETGLSGSAVKKYVAAGPGDDFSKSLRVKEGEQYLLVADNVDNSGSGHKLMLHWPVLTLEKEAGADEMDTIVTKVMLKVREKEAKEPVKAKIHIEGVEKGKTISVKDKSEFEFNVGKHKKIDVNVVARGYMFETWTHRCGGKPDSVEKIFQLEKIKSGSRLKLEKLYFEGNAATLLPGSKGTLEALLSFMEENPGLEIEIEGHVNGPNSRNTKGYKRLSLDRAEAVKEYLVDHGVETDQISTKGYGNKHMIYPSPKTEGQSAANRRVEILVK